MTKLLLPSLALFLALAEMARAAPTLQEQMVAESDRRKELVKPLEQALAQGEKLAAQG